MAVHHSSLKCHHIIQVLNRERLNVVSAKYGNRARLPSIYQGTLRNRDHFTCLYGTFRNRLVQGGCLPCIDPHFTYETCLISYCADPYIIHPGRHIQDVVVPILIGGRSGGRADNDDVRAEHWLLPGVHDAPGELSFGIGNHEVWQKKEEPESDGESKAGQW